MESENKETLLSRITQEIDRVFIISDTHFFHSNILLYEPTRMVYLDTHQSFEEFLVDNWNDTITDRDIVIHLGDFAFKEVQRFTEDIRLRGEKILIAGNHDHRKKKISYLEKIFNYVIKDGTILILRTDGIEEVLTGDKAVNGIILQHDGTNILLSHYPVFQYDEYYNERVWLLHHFYQHYNCLLNIHGHVHYKDEVHYDLFNASVERIDFKPIRLISIINQWKKYTSCVKR
jgi:calcineurin-like phosphoesterase family protein